RFSRDWSSDVCSSDLIGLNVLKHTRHEPITRVFVIEECWPKKFNLPDAIWKMRYDDPKNVQKYYRQRVALLPDGTVTQLFTSWEIGRASCRERVGVRG